MYATVVTCCSQNLGGMGIICDGEVSWICWACMIQMGPFKDFWIYIGFLCFCSKVFPCWCSEFKRFPGNNPFFLWKGLLLETIQTKVLWTSKGKGWCNLKMCSYTSTMSFLSFCLCCCCFNGRMGPRWMVRSIKFLFDFLSEAQKMKKMKPWRNS